MVHVNGKEEWTMVTEMGNILIVDDEELIRRSIRKKLAALGYVCGEASDAHEALEKMSENPADLVIGIFC